MVFGALIDLVRHRPGCARLECPLRKRSVRRWA